MRQRLTLIRQTRLPEFFQVANTYPPNVIPDETPW